jgi:pullulanase/glycogen debranching enzyme
MSTSRTQSRGRSFPLGATLTPYGVNFSVFAKHNTAVQLLLFDRTDDARPSRIIDLDPHINRTYHYSHCFVPSITAGQLYGHHGLKVSSIRSKDWVLTPTNSCSIPMANASPVPGLEAGR